MPYNGNMVTAVVLAASAVAPFLIEAPRPIWAGFGVNVGVASPQRGEMDLLQKGGFQYVRATVPWDQTEKQPGVYDFARFDMLLRELKSKRIRPIFCLTGGNDAFQVGAPTMPEAKAAFTRWAAEAANHFKGEEIIWELWDEPNSDRSWKPTTSATDYASLALEAAKAMRFMDSGCRIIAPGTVAVDHQYLGSALNQELLSVIDGVSIHPNRSGGPESIVEDVQQVRDLIQRRAPEGRKNLPVLCTGWGYSTARGKNSEGRQAMYVTRMWLLNSALGVPVTIYDSWQDTGPDPDNPKDRLGLVRENLDLKPSFIAAKEVLAKFRGCSSFRWVPQKDPLDWVILGAGNGKLIQARWYQKEAGLKYSDMSLKQKKNKALYASLMGASTVAVASSRKVVIPTPTAKPVAPVALTGLEFAFAPPLDDDGWCVLVEKSAPTPAKLEFRYLRSTGSSVICYARVESARSVEPLAISEPKTSISVGMNGQVGSTYRVEATNLSKSDWAFKSEGAASGEVSEGQRGLVLSYAGAGRAMIVPNSRQPIPEGAKALVVWVRPDGIGNRLTSEVRNLTGETISIELGKTENVADRSGWRVVKIPLNGTSSEWVTFLSVEAESGRGGAIEIGPAAYMF